MFNTGVNFGYQRNPSLERKVAFLLMLGFAALVFSDSAFALTANKDGVVCSAEVASKTEGCELFPLYQKINSFLNGIFLKIAGIVAVIMGIGVGMAKSSIQPAAMGIVFGVVTLALPSIMNNFFGALI